jgi:hypothetical protein
VCQFLARIIRIARVHPAGDTRLGNWILAAGRKQNAQPRCYVRVVALRRATIRSRILSTQSRKFRSSGWPSGGASTVNSWRITAIVVAILRKEITEVVDECSDLRGLLG